MKLITSTLALLLAVVTTAASAQVYPTKQIRWVVPYTPGGYTDTVTRMVTARVQQILGQTIVVENKPGANSIIGVESVARANPDGYTILTVITAHAANAFAPNTVGELIAYAKANPGKVSFASSGVGSAAHLTSELLKQTAGIDMVHIPYKGTAPALTDLTAGNVQIMVDVPSSMMQHVNSGKIKALGMFSAERLPVAANVPTVPQSGGPAIVSSSWVMFLAPAGTPAEIVDKLSRAVAEAVRSPELTARFNDLGIIPVGDTPAQAKAFLSEEIANWQKVIKTADVKAE